jgi:hypothetical protein
MSETHESLAEPKGEVEPARPQPCSRRRGVLVAAAVGTAVAVIAVGASHAAHGPQASIPSGPSNKPATGGHQPPLPPLQNDAANRAAAEREAEHAMATMPVYATAIVSDQQGVPELNDHWLSQVQPVDNTVVRSSWWTVSGATPSLVAQWYADHAPSGFHSDGTVGGQGDGTRWVDEVYYVEPGHDELPPSGTMIELQTTRTAEGVGIRATVDSVWSPARPRTSYVQDVTSIDVTSTHSRFGRHMTTTRRSFTITDPDRVLRAAVAFDALQGAGPFGPISCPAMLDSYRDRIVFHTRTGDLVAVAGASCVVTLGVSRDGRPVGPALEEPHGLFAVLGLHH